MEEKKIIEGKFYNSLIMLGIGAALIFSTFVLARIISDAWFDKPGFILMGIGIVCVIFYFWMGLCKIIVTDKRVYGKAAFGKQVDLPIDSISAVGTISLFKGVSVATSSGVIKFYIGKKLYGSIQCN